MGQCIRAFNMAIIFFGEKKFEETTDYCIMAANHGRMEGVNGVLVMTAFGLTKKESAVDVLKSIKSKEQMQRVCDAIMTGTERNKEKTIEFVLTGEHKIENRKEECQHHYIIAILN